LLVIILIEQQGLTKAVMASRMDTSRSALDRLLDPDNDSVTLKTLVGCRKGKVYATKRILLPV
jgi:hypothetical protein